MKITKNNTLNSKEFKSFECCLSHARQNNFEFMIWDMVVFRVTPFRHIATGYYEYHVQEEPEYKEKYHYTVLLTIIDGRMICDSSSEVAELSLLFGKDEIVAKNKKIYSPQHQQAISAAIQQWRDDGTKPLSHFLERVVRPLVDEYYEL